MIRFLSFTKVHWTLNKVSGNINLPPTLKYDQIKEKYDLYVKYCGHL